MWATPHGGTHHRAPSEAGEGRQGVPPMHFHSRVWSGALTEYASGSLDVWCARISRIVLRLLHMAFHIHVAVMASYSWSH